jgi:hypothetical protein
MLLLHPSRRRFSPAVVAKCCAMAEPIASFQTLGRFTGGAKRRAVKNTGIVLPLHPPLILIKINGGTPVSDRKPIIIAVAVGTLALGANGTAAVVALSAAAPPQAMVFGIVGLTAAFIGLITTILWAWRDDVKPQPKRGRVFTPWVPPHDDTEAYLLPEPGRHSVLALAAAAPAPRAAPVVAPAPTMVAAPADGRVVYLQDWLKTHRAEHAPA